ncbi:hypothetical protein FA13DRAFT_1691267 [Coprinellus micaceus]|uniref:Uncharacterized protein n=1 Tax=Coprinellus micaceus TaxID=71717 RepID=A0A4Y7T0L4_COPMI|nr:hypothetical protein FA13DRAFT_1691267 [Coprinellus micaceus]
MATPLDSATHKMYMKYYLVSFWLEGVYILGVYVVLFGLAIRVMVRRRSIDNTASRVFFIGIIAMFVLVNIHNWLNIYRMLTAYTASDDPVAFLHDLQNWDAFMFPVVCAILTWIGDVLVIYRCFLVWQRNWWIIAMPILLLLASIGTTSVNLFWFGHQTSIPWSVMEPLFRITFPLNLVQNVLTTSFIAYKIFCQHRLSQRTGLLLSAGLNLMTILRIIAESALLYTAVMFTCTVLYYTKHPSQVIVQHMIPPVTGIVFALIAVRTHVARGTTVTGPSRGTTSGSDSVVPNWLTGEDECTRRGSTRKLSIPIVTTTTEYRMEVIPARYNGARESKVRSQSDEKLEV